MERTQEEHRRRTGHGKFAGLNDYSPERYYALVRSLEPGVVVETGVCNGVSTLVVLAALGENGKGELRSVDLPDPERLPKGESPGWIVPEKYRHRWTLVSGRSEENLEELLVDVDTVDLFLHDSIAEILEREYELVAPKLRSGGVVIADDIYNSNFTRFG